MRYNKEETRKALIYECSRSTSNSEIKKYALEMVEDLDDGEYFRNPTLKKRAETHARGFERLRTNRMWGRNGKNI